MVTAEAKFYGSLEKLDHVPHAKSIERWTLMKGRGLERMYVFTVGKVNGIQFLLEINQLGPGKYYLFQ